MQSLSVNLEKEVKEILKLVETSKKTINIESMSIMLSRKYSISKEQVYKVIERETIAIIQKTIS